MASPKSHALLALVLQHVGGRRVVHRLVRRGRALGLIDELDDVESVLRGVVDDEEDDDGDGVTTGGVVDDVVLVSRWQPETPSAMPVQSNVTRAALLIVISRSG